MMVWSGDFGGGYESCSHWSNFWYPRKDSTRYPRQVGPIERTPRASKRPCKHLHPACVQRRHGYRDASVMVLWYLSRNFKLPLVEIQGKQGPLGRISTRSSTLRLCHTLTSTRYRTSHVHAQWSHARRTLRIPRNCCAEKPMKFWIDQAEVLIWMWSKTCSVSSNDNQTMPTPSSTMWRTLCEVHRMWNDIPRASTRHLIHSCRRRVPDLLSARGDFIWYWHFILQLCKISSFKCCHELVWSETWFLISPQFQV